MKHIFLIIASAALALFAGCAKQEPVQNEQVGRTICLTLEATRGDAPDTKTSVSADNEYRTLFSEWSPGDKIKVYSMKTCEVLGTLVQTGEIVTQTTSSARIMDFNYSYTNFTGSITLGAGDNIEDTFVFIHFPLGKQPTYADGKLIYELKAYTDVSQLKELDIAYGRGTLKAEEIDPGKIEYRASNVMFSNPMSFGYFTTENIEAIELYSEYPSSGILDIIGGQMTAGPVASISLPLGKKFYLPMVLGPPVFLHSRALVSNNGTLAYKIYTLPKAIPIKGGTYVRNKDFSPIRLEENGGAAYSTFTQPFYLGNGQYVYFTQGNLQQAPKMDISPAGQVFHGEWLYRIAPSQYSYSGAFQAVPLAPSYVISQQFPNGVSPTAAVDLFAWGWVDVRTPQRPDDNFYPFNSPISSNVEQPLPDSQVSNWVTAVKSFNVFAAQSVAYPYPQGGNISKLKCLSPTEWRALFNNQFWSFVKVRENFFSDTIQGYGIVVFPYGTTKESARALLNGQYPLKGLDGGDLPMLSITESAIDQNGLLFLPAAGYRSGENIEGVNTECRYWTNFSATTNDGTYKAYAFRLTRDGAVHDVVAVPRSQGASVRLAIIATP